MDRALERRARRSVVVVTDRGEVLEAGRACLFVLHELGWHPRLVWLARRRPLVWLVEAGYRLVAGSRGLIGRLLRL